METTRPTYELGTFVETVNGTPVYRLRPSALSRKCWFYAKLGGRHVFRPDYESLYATIVAYQTTCVAIAAEGSSQPKSQN